jgi:LysR family nitrogen assimilation transcriptional regulator
MHFSYPGDLLVHLASFLTLVRRVETRPDAAFESAARTLGVDRTVLRRRLHALSRWCGGALLIGRGAGLMPTERGRRVAEQAAALLGRVATLRDPVDAPDAELRVACTGTITTGLLPDVLVALRRGHRRTRVRVRRAGGAACVRMVESGEIDVGIVRGTRVAGAIPLCADRLWLVTPRGHPLARKRGLDRAALMDAPLVLYDASSRTRARVLERLPDAFIPIEVDGKASAVEYVRRGFGISFLSMVPWQRPRFPGVEARDVTSLFRPTTFEVLCAPGRRDDPGVVAFVEALRSHVERRMATARRARSSRRVPAA